uniref:Rho-GAP domain-containing protein n=1 Tax=Panagrellus redivivus TaxID=6233 RepID=A0A7E4VRI3_PANRE
MLDEVMPNALSPTVHVGSRLDARKSLYKQRSPLPTRSTSILKINECQHFHYDYVEIGPVTITVETDEESLLCEESYDQLTFRWVFCIQCNEQKWIIQRTFAEFAEFDCQLHRCVFDRRHSRLAELRQLRVTSNNPYSTTTVVMNTMEISPSSSTASYNASVSTTAASWTLNNPIKVRRHLVTYVERLSELTGSIITCFPVLKFLELDSRGNHFIPIEQSQINTPAVAAAIVIKDFTETKPGELSIKVGDIVSVIEMKTLEQSDNVYWKGKLTITKKRPLLRGSRTSLPTECFSTHGHQFVMGYFPSSCVKLFSSKIEPDECVPSKRSLYTRSFINRHQNMWKLRPKVLQSSFWRNRARQVDIVFGADLAEHLAKTNLDVPLVLTKCIEVLETHGLVTGIYRQCGIQSNIRNLRWQFDNNHPPDLTDEKILRDIHCVSSLLKQYFRQLPNPLFTYELYPEILRAYESETKDRVANVAKVLRQLPPAHYRTARTLMHHLSMMCRHKGLTDMTASNLAIVWAPNLFRNPPSIDMQCQLLKDITIHKNMCNFFIVHANVLFDDANDSTLLASLAEDEIAAEMTTYLRHKENNFQASRLPGDRACIDVNGGPAMLPAAFHTVIDLPQSKKNQSKWKKLLRYSSLEHSLAGLWNRRSRSRKTSPSRAYILPDIQLSSSSSNGQEMRRSESMFSYVAKNVEDFGQNVVRSVRNFSIRRSKRWRRNESSVESSSSAADDFELLRNLRLRTEEPFAQMTQSSVENGTVIQPGKLIRSVSDDVISGGMHKGLIEIEEPKPKRVMFETSERAEQFFYHVDSPDHDNSQSGDVDSDTDVSSQESLPLDVSRYDNVLPQKTAHALLSTQPQQSPPSVYEDAKNLIISRPLLD